MAPRATPRATPRAVSPAASENEVDILGSLFTDDSAISHGNISKDDARAGARDGFGFGFDANELLDAPDDEGDDGDEAFIALKQAASFRKASNLKGKTVKKGGGFQAMGSSRVHPVPHRIRSLLNILDILKLSSNSPISILDFGVLTLSPE